MPITVRCHVCGGEWQVANVNARKTGQCPKCGEHVSIPVQAGASSEAYDPGSLPRVSAVEVVELPGVDPSRLRDRAATPGVRAVGRAAARVADLWRGLPPGVVPATHLPAYGLRFLDEDRVVGWASVCWVGGSIRGEFDGVSADYSFDIFDAGAMDLFQELHRITRPAGGL